MICELPLFNNIRIILCGIYNYFPLQLGIFLLLNDIYVLYHKHQLKHHSQITRKSVTNHSNNKVYLTLNYIYYFYNH